MARTQSDAPSLVEAWLAHPGYAVSQVRLLRGNPVLGSGAVVYVEGTLDQDFFSKTFPNYSGTHIIAAGSKDVLIEAAASASRDDVGIVFITDADDEYMVRESRRPEWPTVPRFKTDQRDMEAFLVGSAPYLAWVEDPLAGVVNRLGLAEEFRLFEKSHGVTLREALARTAAPLGAMLCAKTELGLTHPVLSYRELDYEDLITDIDGLNCDPDMFTERVVARLGCALSASQLSDAMSPYLRRLDEAPWKLCRGHDVCALLAMKATRIDPQGRRITRERVEHELRGLSYEPTFLVGTHLLDMLREWQSHNPRYALL